MNRAFLFLFYVVLARLQGDRVLGEYSIITTYTGLVFVFVLFGLERIVLREVSRNPRNIWQVLMSVFRLQIFMWIVIMPVATLIALFLGYEFRMVWIIGLLMLWVPGSCLFVIVDQSLMAIERMDISSFLSVFSAIQLLILGSLVLWLGWGLVAIALVMIWERFSTALLGIYLLKKNIDLNHSLSFHKNYQPLFLLKASIPFAMLNLIGNMHQRIDVLLMPEFVSFSDIGQYSTAYRVLEATIMIPTVIASASFPEMARSFKDAYAHYQTVAGQSLKNSLALSNIVIGFLFLFSGPIVRFIFGSQFSLAAQLLQILTWGLFFQSINNTLGRSIIAVDLEWFFIPIAILALLSNVFLNLYLLPKIGVFGSAVATLGSYALSTLAHLYILWKNERLPLLRESLLVIFSFIIAGLFVVATQEWWNMSYMISGFLGVSVYIASLLKFRIFSWPGLGTMIKHKIST